ncbi:MAG: nitrate reductase [Calditrichaeota bacterium]|nr:MAG: nitrate reductase [Calditrichota bacterium]MBL1205091.1 nitrate reductase [Calditrichota bacterium]NOG44921.1 nitrate reductase [Calditrichota bacterium]
MLKKILQSAIVVLLSAVLFSACSSTTTQVKKAEQTPVVKAVADDELSYRNLPLNQEDAAPAKKYSDIEPGESKTYQRSFENAPPMIPHDVADLLPIKKDDNQCLDCHHPSEAADSEAPSTPASHFYDIRQNKKLDDLAGANFNCTQCHAPQSDAPQIIRNEFKPEYRNAESKKSSNLLDILNEGIDE